MSGYNNESYHEQILKQFQDWYQTDKLSAWSQVYNKLHNKQTTWSVSLETLIKNFIQASIELGKYSEIKSIMIPFKFLTQVNYTDSLNSILSFYKQQIELKFKQSIKDFQVPSDLGDVDLQESPEELYILNYNIDEKLKRDQLKQLIKMRIECYKGIIETVKTNNKCLEILQKTIDSALHFFEKYNRSSELSKFVSLITFIYPTIKKNEGLRKKIPTYINIKEKEVQTIQLEIRFKVYDLCKKLGQGQNCLKLMEDVKSLIRERFGKKDETKKRFLSMYYEYLSEIFRDSQYYNFHAIFFLKHFEYFIKYNEPQDEKVNQQKADQAILAILSIPFNAIDLKLSQEKFQKVKDFILDPYKYIPSQQELILNLKNQNIIESCSPEVQQLYNLLSGNINIFSISQNFSRISEKIAQTSGTYLNLLKQNVVFKVLKQLSQIYSTMKIERIKEIIGFYDEGQIISLMLEAGSIAHINCNIDFSRNIILFGRTNKVESASGTLCYFAEKCKKVVLELTQDAPISQKLKGECAQYLKEADDQNEKRANGIKRIKHYIKSIQNEESKNEQLQQQELERLERDRIQKEIKRQKLLEEQRKSQIADHLRQVNKKIDEIKKIKGKFETKIGGVKIEDMTDEDKLECDIESFNDLHNQVQELLKNDVEDRAKKMFQKFDYISREIRITENKAIQSIQDNSKELEEAIKVSEQKFTQDKELKEQITKTQVFKEKFFAKVIEMREKKFQENIARFKEACEAFRAKIQQRALEKLNDYKIQQEIEEEEKRKREEEERENNLQNYEKQKEFQIKRNQGQLVEIKPQDSDDEEDKGKQQKDVFKRGTGTGIQAQVSKDREENIQKSDNTFRKGDSKREDFTKAQSSQQEGWGKGKGIVTDKKKEELSKFKSQKEPNKDDGFQMVKGKSSGTYAGKQNQDQPQQNNYDRDHRYISTRTKYPDGKTETNVDGTEDKRFKLNRPPQQQDDKNKGSTFSKGGQQSNNSGSQQNESNKPKTSSSNTNTSNTGFSKGGRTFK